jgi:hypothetical protein
MRRADSATVCALATCLSCAAPPHIVTVSPSEATVVAFVRPAREAPTREAHDSAAAHLGFALHDTSACLGLPANRALLLEAEALSVPFGGNDYIFTASPTSGVGAVLLSSEKPPLEVPAPAGASALVVLLPSAAASYFEAPRCKPDL